MAGRSKTIVIRNRLPQVAQELQSELPRIVRTATFQTERETKRNAPVDTGQLRAGYRSEISVTGRRGEVVTNVEYAPYVEFGTRKMRAQPHLRPAFEQASKWIDGQLTALARRLGR